MKSSGFCRCFFVGASRFVAFAMGISGASAAGVAVLKEWNFHRDSTAKPVVYLRIIDSHGPYLRLVTRRGNIDILRSKLADYVEVPDSLPSQIMEEEDASSLRAYLTTTERFSGRYPRSAVLLDPLTDALASHLARFEAGQVRFEGNWMERNDLDALLAGRQREAVLARQREIEHVIFSEAQEERGLVMRNGKWMGEAESRDQLPSGRTELSGALWPLINPDIDGARMALQNLESLATSQTGAAKVRTQRVHAVIRNLFLAEYRFAKQIISNSAAKAEATRHEQSAKQWLKPNAFGTVRTDEARDSLAKAQETNRRASQQLQTCRAALLDQLHEADVVICDLYQLREHRAALVLAEMIQAKATQNFPPGEFTSSLQPETLSAIRAEISSGK